MPQRRPSHASPIPMRRSRLPPSAGFPNSRRAWFATCGSAGRKRGARPIPGPPARPGTGRPDYFASSRSTRCRLLRTSKVRALRNRSDRASSRRMQGAALLPPAGRSAGIARHSMDLMRRLTASSRRSSTCSLIDVFFHGEEWARWRPQARGFVKLKLKSVSDCARRQGVARGRRFSHRRPDGVLCFASFAVRPSRSNSPTLQRGRRARRGSAVLSARCRHACRLQAARLRSGCVAWRTKGLRCPSTPMPDTRLPRLHYRPRFRAAAWSATCAFAGRSKKWASLTTFVFFRSGDEGIRASRASSFRADSDL